MDASGRKVDLTPIPSSMASATRRLLLQSRRCPAPAAAHSTRTRTAQWQRPFSSTRSRRDGQDGADDGAAREAEAMAQLLQLDARMKAEAQREQRGRAIAPEDQLEADDFEEDADDRRLTKIGFWADGEVDMGPDEDFHGDDITSHGHGELQSHRYLREYARLIAWELPLLNQLARPFEPPTAATPFRFRYTSYLGESHPAANKVVVEFSPSDLGLAAVQRAKLIKLAGPRYNPGSDLVKLSTEQFDTQTQNKRFLGETIQTLITEAKDPADTFEDVPFDFRHHTPKVHHAFPEAWIMTPARKQYLADKRAAAARLEDQRRGNGEIVDGHTLVETSLPLMEQAVPVLVAGKRR